MKKFVKFIGVIFLSLSITLVFGQNVVNKNNLHDFQKNNDTGIKEMTSFSYKVIENKVFFKLLVNNLKEDCVFVIERSIENEDYKPIALKMGKANAHNIDLLYCFKDTLDFENDKAYYRLKQIFETSGTYLSNIHVVENEPYYYLADYK